MMLAAFFVIAEANLPRAETYRLEEPCGIALIGACLPRKVVAWERTHGAVVEATQGFTLVEIAIVLMVIGLIVGGILWGADMIGAAATRAQISQVEKFNTAANTFVTKYGYLPGDIPDPYASQFGFQPRGSLEGQGDGNGLLEGWKASGNVYRGNLMSAGETAMFWVDLSAAGMLEGSFNTASPTVNPVSDSTTPSAIGLLLPSAKIGNGNYVYAYSLGTVAGGNGINYFGLSAVNDLKGSDAHLYSNATITVQQAFNIDKKIDDGLPQTGNVIAVYLNGDPYWTDGTDTYYNPPSTSITPSSPLTCYDNGGASGQQHYSMEVSNGSNPNCALSFKMQGAAR